MFCRKQSGTLLIHPVCFVVHVHKIKAKEPPHNKTNKKACAPSEDSDQPQHPSSLIRVFPVHMKKAWVLNYPLNAQRRLWSDWVNAEADLSLRWAHMPFCSFLSWGGSKYSLYKHQRGFILWELNQKQILALCKFSSIYTCDTCFIFRELPEMSHKISSKTYHFLPKFWSFPHLNEKCS